MRLSINISPIYLNVWFQDRWFWSWEKSETSLAPASLAELGFDCPRCEEKYNKQYIITRQYGTQQADIIIAEGTRHHDG